jgi:MFS family permease
VGSSIYSPAVSAISAEFHVSNVVALLGVTLYVLGLAFGPVLSAPLSETYGRLIVYRLSLFVSMLFTLGAGFSTSLASLLICRFFAGLTGSPVLAVGAATNADLFPPKSRANATSMFLLAPFLGTAIG